MSKNDKLMNEKKLRRRLREFYTDTIKLSKD